MMFHWAVSTGKLIRDILKDPQAGFISTAFQLCMWNRIVVLNTVKMYNSNRNTFSMQDM